MPGRAVGPEPANHVAYLPMTTPELDPKALTAVTGGNWVNTVMDNSIGLVYPGWKAMDCVSRASIAGEVGRDLGLVTVAGAGHRTGHKHGLAGGVLAGSILDGIPRQYAMVSYNEGCKAK